MSAAGIIAVSCVALTKVVASVEGGTAGNGGGGLTTQFTTELLTKFVPFTVSVTLEGLHAGVELPDVVDDVTVVIVGPVIVNVIPGGTLLVDSPCVKTLTVALPVVRKSAGGTVAVNCVALV